MTYTVRYRLFVGGSNSYVENHYPTKRAAVAAVRRLNRKPHTPYLYYVVREG